jgi:hypothetical protein
LSNADVHVDPTTEPDAALSVFINCPYDEEYEPLFDALVLAIVSCGLIPRCALESGKVSVSRMDRIFNAIKTSSCSIHDLCRCQGEGEQLLARFNMPLELGIAMSRKLLEGDRAHDWLALVPERAPYVQFVSDLAGYDLPVYDSTAESLLRVVMSWLQIHPEALPDVTPSQVLANIPKFRREKERLKSEWGSVVPWKQLVKAASRIGLGSP